MPSYFVFGVSLMIYMLSELEPWSTSIYLDWVLTLQSSWGCCQNMNFNAKSERTDFSFGSDDLEKANRTKID
jgi:hypothetical protein